MKEIDLRKGVGFAIRSALVRKLTSLPKGVNERLITESMLASKGGHVTFISVYACTMTNDDETKGMFSLLLETINKDLFHDFIVRLGDLDVRFRSDYSSWPGVLAKRGVRKINSIGLSSLFTL